MFDTLLCIGALTLLQPSGQARVRDALRGLELRHVGKSSEAPRPCPGAGVVEQR